MDRLELIIREERVQIFVKMVDECDVGVQLAFRILIEIPRWLDRMGVSQENISDDLLCAVADAAAKSELRGSELRPLMLALANAPNDKARYKLLDKCIADCKSKKGAKK